MTSQEIITILVQYGLPTVLLFAGAWFHVAEKRAWDTERRDLTKAAADEGRLRVEDAKLGFATLRDMQAKVTDSIAKLSDEAEHRRLQRELIDAVAKLEGALEAIERRDAHRGPYSGPVR